MKLLLALALDESTEAILDQATRWATALRAQLDVVYVDVLADPALTVSDATLQAMLVAERTKIRAEQQARLTALAADLPEAIRGQAQVRIGQAHTEIVAAADGYDAVLLGTHGRAGFDRLFLGSVAERVVRLAPCPVVVLRPPADATRAGPFRALLAVDIRHPAVDAVLAEGIRWATSLGAILDLGWVDPYDYDMALIRDTHIRGRVAAEWDRIKQSDAERLERMIAQIPEGNRGEARRLEGRPAPALVDAAVGYDTVLIATQGRTGLGHLFIGSVAERVVRQAPVPVVVLRLAAATRG